MADQQISEFFASFNRTTPAQESEKPKKYELLDSKIRLIADIQKEANVSNRQIKQMRRILKTRI
tara:strand:- start:1832 stop:2023 length:192 start_codon:yes stop_codon:yes gene_type:complete